MSQENGDALAAVTEEQFLAGLADFDTDPTISHALDGDITTRELDTGEKADDAVNFFDIDDDDLGDLDDDDDLVPASAEPATALQSERTADLFGDDGEDDDFGALFGDDQDGRATPPPADKQEVDVDDDLFDEGPSAPAAVHTLRDIKEAAEQEVEEEDDDTRLQRYLFGLARRRREGLDQDELADQADFPPAPVSNEDVFSVVFPDFEAGVPPLFGALLPQKKAYFPAKVPLKPPRPVQITKVSLDIEQDQERGFRLPGQATHNLAARQAQAEAKGLVLITNTAKEQADQEDEMDFSKLEDEMDDIGGVKWQDLVALCQDWTIPEDNISEDGLVEMEPEGDVDEFGETALFDGLGEQNEWHIERPAKRQKRSHDDFRSMYSVQNVNSMVDNPEEAISKLARKLQLDLNDPYILVDLEKSAHGNAKRRVLGSFKRDAVGGLSKDFTRRYNISNDEAYEALKANQSHKVRSNLQNVEIQHALPAAKLQYPFYKVRLTPKEARSFHRPALQPGTGVAHIAKNGFVKRKHLKGRETQNILQHASDLSIADNSSILLLEYSEEYPAMLSGFGMGSKLINYYRRKDNEDTARPKGDIGETQVLMPEDKSPFSIFGDVERGQTMPTLLNTMYRAPVFQHKPSGRDFVVARSQTYTDGTNYHFRNVENLHVVGQEFPLVEVPGTHSRKVTDAAKKRLRMLSYRMFRTHGRLKNEMLLPHLPGSDVAQNRSKMREFMEYDKDRGWLPRRGEVLPEEPEIRAMIKPEDVCLIYSMQVGDRQLQDAGYNKDEDGAEAEEDDDDTNNLDKMLAPWQTTKNFLNACQGKAMLMLHGEGDPSGRGEAFSFIRTSMKGGFKAAGQSVEDHLMDKKKKESGGHTYNVARQQQAYTDAIKKIWDSQQKSLSSAVEHEIDVGGVEDRPEHNSARHSGGGDEEASVFSRASTSAESGKILRIVREYTDQYGRHKKEEEVITDPRVIREYSKRRKQIDISEMSFDQMQKTGDTDLDREQTKAMRAELARLERNKERRLGREKAKGILPTNAAGSPEPGTPGGAGSPAPDTGTPAEGPTKGKRNTGAATQRKCANCGQVGHIKTNKKLCPMLNGTVKLESSQNGFGSSVGGGGGGGGFSGFGAGSPPPPSADGFGSSFS